MAAAFAGAKHYIQTSCARAGCKREATDEAICLTIQSLRSNADVDCIALLSTDKGFARPLQECKVSGTRAVVFFPESKKGVIDFYEANSLRVQQLPVVQTCPKVRALLYANGSGTVKLAEPFAELYDEGRTEAVKEFLKSQGHLLGKDAYWIQPLAKFRFANALGTLPVFPAQLALSAMSKVISSASRSQSWHFHDRQLAFCIPISSQGRQENGAGVSIWISRCAERFPWWRSVHAT